MKNVNPELYDFLKENETGLYSDIRFGEVIAFVHIHFSDLDSFVRIVGDGHFDEGGSEVIMFTNTICIEVNDIIESLGHSLYDYKFCFDVDSWNEHEVEIRKDWV